MNWLVLLYYPILIFVLLWGMKISKKDEFHDGFLSLSQTKSLQGFAAIGIVFHHIGQNTCAPWLAPEQTIHGLEPFVPIGYLLVAIFFFCSGYGLMKSFNTKENYLKGFFLRRALHPVFLLLVTDTVLLFLMAFNAEALHIDENLHFPTPFNMGGALLINEYSWFIYALLIMYASFRLSFSIFSKRPVAILGVILATAAYIGFCDWWMYGNWWYNSILLFPLGLLMAEYEGRIVPMIHAHYRKLLIATPVVLVLTFLIGEYFTTLCSVTGIIPPYFLLHWIVLLAQIAAAVSFMFLLILIGMKVRIGNRILAFFGCFTGEFYLIHVLFLRILATGVEEPKLFTIDNLALYVLIVLAATTATSYLLHLFAKLTAYVVKKNPVFLKLFVKDLYVFALIALAFLIYAVFSIYNESKAYSAEWSDDLVRYREENIVYTEVDGLNMAAYVTGEGKHTVVLLGSSFDYFSTLSLRPLADRMAESNRVIILDYFGCGFSDDTTSERTAENYVREIRAALTSLGEEGPYILMPNEISGLYSLLYATEYPEEVEAIIALDTLVAGQHTDMMYAMGLTPSAYRTRLQREHFALRPLNEFARFTGLNRTTWFLTEHHLKYNQSEATLPLIAELYHMHVGNENALNARMYYYDNHERLIGVKYPSDLPVLSILGSQSVEGRYYPESDWRALHDGLISNPELQEVIEIPGNPYFAFSLPKEIAAKAQPFIDGLE